MRQLTALLCAQPPVPGIAERAALEAAVLAAQAAASNDLQVSPKNQTF